MWRHTYRVLGVLVYTEEVINIELLAMHTQCKSFVDSDIPYPYPYILRTYEIYFEYDFTDIDTVIICRDVDTKHEYKVILPYIQRDKNILFDVAKAIINTNAVQ